MEELFGGIGALSKMIVGLRWWYEGYSKINLRLVGKDKRVVIASKHTLSSNKELLFLIGIWVQSITQQVYLTMFIEDENITTCFGLIRPSSGYIQRVSDICNNFI